MTDAEETGEIERVLRAAGLTYVVRLLQQLGLLYALVQVAEGTRRLATSCGTARAAEARR